MEIKIHRALCHKHIVGFQGFFEDDNYVYILLEICRRRVRLQRYPLKIRTYTRVSFAIFVACLIAILLLNLCFINFKYMKKNKKVYFCETAAVLKN